MQRVKGFIHRLQHVANANVRRHLGELVSPARPSHGGHQLRATQLHEQLFQIGQRNPLPLRNLAQRNKAVAFRHPSLEGDIGKRHHGVSAFRAEFHGAPSRELIDQTRRNAYLLCYLRAIRS